MTLDETDNSTETTGGDATTVAETKRPRGRVTIDLDAKTVSYAADGAPTLASGLAGLPDKSRDWLALSALGRLMSTAVDPTKFIAELRSGIIPGRSGPTKPKPVSILRQAVAAALVEITKKSENPLTLEQAAERVAGMDRSTIDAQEIDPIVAKHLLRLTPPEKRPNLAALAGIA